MSIMPISYYPMPSDDKSQIVALREGKSELSNRAQDVEQGGMSEQQKRRALAEIDEKTDQANQEIHKKQVSLSVKQHDDVQRQLKTQQGQKTAAQEAAKTCERQKAEGGLDRYV